jgi:2',3'-cyclic-nucleotide 2'-phosphodiesterase (5'-nucleotidase family)
VTVPASGKVLVILTTEAKTSAINQSAYMGFAVSGATTLAASDTRAYEVRINGGSGTPLPQIQASATYRVTGLTPGSNTFTAKYRVTGGTGTWANRNIVVIPLP